MALAKDFLAFSAANPATGDNMGRLLWIMVIALVVSVIVIIAIAAMGKKSRKGRRKK